VEDDSGVFVHCDLDQGLEVAQLQRQRVSRHHVGRLRELAGGESFAFGGDALPSMFSIAITERIGSSTR
jgi:hypothetical protein